MATYEQLSQNSPDGSIWGLTASDKLGFYGKIPIIQRAFSAAVHQTDQIASSADFAAGQLAAVNEIQKTLVALGIWATA